METPELDKILAAQAESEVIGAFLEWAEENGYHLVFTEMATETYTSSHNGQEAERKVPVEVPVADFNMVLLKYFNIDPAKVAAEQKAALAEIRNHSVCQRGATPEAGS